MIAVSTATAFTIAAVLGLGGAALAVASRYWPWWRHHPAATPAPVVVGRPYFPCHSGVCAHMSTQHVLTPIGHVCRNCGTPRTEAPSA